MKFISVYCSQCGGMFGPGDAGFSHCKDHSVFPTHAKPPAGTNVFEYELANHGGDGPEQLVCWFEVDNGEDMTRWEPGYPACAMITHMWVNGANIIDIVSTKLVTLIEEAFWKSYDPTPYEL